MMAYLPVRWVCHYQKAKKLSPANGGSDSKLSDRETCELIDHLSEITYLHLKDICQYVRLRHKKKYSVSGMTKWLYLNKFCYMQRL
jgi:hypothetical protein